MVKEVPERITYPKEVRKDDTPQREWGLTPILGFRRPESRISSPGWSVGQWQADQGATLLGMVEFSPH